MTPHVLVNVAEARGRPQCRALISSADRFALKAVIKSPKWANAPYVFRFAEILTTDRVCGGIIKIETLFAAHAGDPTTTRR